MINGLFDKQAVFQVLGCLIQDPNLLDNNNITPEDFNGEDFHQIVFGAIYNLHYQGVNVIDCFAIDSYLNSFSKQYKIFSDNNGLEYVSDACAMAEMNNFDYNLTRVKKFTLLRYYDSQGLDIRRIYDPTVIDPVKQEEEMRKFNDYSVQGIIDLVAFNLVTKPQITFSSDANGLEQSAGVGMKEQKEAWKKEPEIGIPLQSQFMNTVARGARIKKFYLRSGSTASGKAIPDYTLLPTPEGYRYVKEIKVGDQLFDRHGKPTTVLAVYPQAEKKEIYRLTFSDGRIAECCEEHLWTYQFVSHGQKKMRTESLKDILKRSAETVGELKVNPGFHFPINAAVEYPEKQYSIPPYVMGLLLGDGSFRYNKSNKALLYSSEDDILPNEIAKIMGWNVKKNSEYNYNYTFSYPEINAPHQNVWVEEVLKDYPGLWQAKSHQKYIPADFLFGSKEQRKELLQGLLDTDGYCSPKGCISFSTTSNLMKEQFIELCRSLGYIAYAYKDNRDDKYTSGECYKISIRCPKEEKISLFRLPKHRQKVMDYLQRSNGKRTFSNDYLRIVKVEKTGEFTDMTCFTVDNDEALFLMNDFIVTHNTRTAVGDACTGAVPWFYDTDQMKWVYTGFAEPTLFISTELEIEEVQSLIIAFVSGVNESHIIDGAYEGDEEERVDQAIEYIQTSPIYIKEMFDFDIQDIENIIVKYKKEKLVQYVYFDYLHTSVKLIMQIANMSKGMKLQEYQILYIFASKLKTLANTLQVHISSSTQLNGEYKDTKIKDETLLRGSKSIADRIDIGVISLPPTKDELKGVENILRQGIYPVPNLIYHVYKVRRGKLTRVRLWLHADLGTCRTRDLFVTDNDYNLIPVERLTIEHIDKVLEENSVDEKEIVAEPDDAVHLLGSNAIPFNF